MGPFRITGYLLCLLVLIYSPVYSQVISCGGFVKSFNKDALSKVKIKLESSEGLRKFETDVTPSNGYYMVPVYNKGSYAIVIEGPTGYVFEPSRIPIIIDGQTDQCTKGIDINFELFGFTVSGKVRSGDLAGPSRLNLALYTEDKKEYATMFTDDSGNYQFNAPPGKYVVSTVDSTRQCIDRGNVAVEVKDRPVTVSPDIRISGHSLVVSVLDDSNAPLVGATVLLVSDQKIPFDQQLNSPTPSSTQKDSKWEYRLLADDAGKATFRCLPPNKYQVSVSWSTKKTSLVFSPPIKTITIASENVNAEFKAEGFDVVGQVQSNKKPLAGVTIFCDGKQVATSDDSGTYRIKALKSGRHTIEGKKEHFYFEKLQHDITIENPAIPAISVTKLEVCGLVKFDNVESHHGQETLISVLKPDGAVVESLHIDKTGRFCTFLPAGPYTIKPAHESQVKPDYVEIKLQDEPVLDVVFTEFKATINGHLNCFQQQECIGAKANLFSNGREIDSVSIQNNAFVFNEVLPGRYTIQVIGLDNVCLDDETKAINVESNNLDVTFKQTGYRAEVHSPIADLKLNWKNGGESGTKTMNTGKNIFCLPKSGTYTFNVENCHEFYQGKTLTHSLPSNDHVTLTVKSAYFSASIQADTNVSPNDFKLQLKTSKGERNLEAAKGSQSNNVTFSTVIDNEFDGQEMELLPKSNKFLFVPATHTWTFNGECAFNEIVFKAKEGRYVTGKVEPAVENAAVQAKHKTDGSVLTSTTDSKGNFKIGLVFNPEDYEVELELEGYKFISTGQNKFKSIKLSKLTVYYADKATKKPLSDVLISLSGDNFRENKIVNPNGQITFVGLPIGEYFVRSVMREYEFEPATSSVKINEGETNELKLFGTRYAYSAFGKVSSAGGSSPSSQMNVEAISKNCGNLQEDDITAEDGQFRVRGLKPKCNYRLSLKSTDGKPISSIPPYIDIQTEEKDTTDLEFNVLSTIPLNEIVGIVEFVDLPKPKNVRVELYENGKYKAHEEVTDGSVFLFSNMITLSNTYRLTISDSDLRNLNANFKPVEFVADQLTRDVILRVGKKEAKPEKETSTSNIFGVIFTLATAFVCFNIDYTKSMLFSFADHFKAMALNREGSPGAQNKRQKAKKT
ncbi:hypothetical protein M3Y97_00835400 [Aphelenchoides bicaudatus]|nr:hypothetical protein M3Y97_00835400 [Aphelenchoides bicaudatus]